MSELKKGDLVMTEYYNLAWVKHQNKNVVIVKPVDKDAFGTQLRTILTERLKEWTLADIEAYLHKKKWFKDGKGGWYKNDSIWSIDDRDDKALPYAEGTLYEDDFDTAPQQLAEAIQVARLLNATKD